MAKVQVKRSKNSKLKVTGKEKSELKKSSSRRHVGSGRKANDAKVKQGQLGKRPEKSAKVVYDQARVDLLAWLI